MGKANFHARHKSHKPHLTQVILSDSELQVSSFDSQTQEVRVSNHKAHSKSWAVSRKDPLECLETTDVTEYVAKLFSKAPKKQSQKIILENVKELLF